MHPLNYFRELSWQAAAPLFLLENVVVLLLALGLGHALRARYGRHRALGPVQHPISRAEIRLAAVTVLLNSGVTYAGFWLWRQGLIVIPEGFSVRALLDFAVLLLGMDLLMYGFHYVIHHTPLHRWVHALHHHYAEPQPIDLFVLHPLETLGFGGLWLLLLAVYPASVWGITAYLVMNVAFGVLGHCGVEPFPAAWARHPLLKYLGSSGFHYEHHQNDQRNFGFYTSLWDRLFGTFAAGPEAGSPRSPAEAEAV